MTVVTDLTQGYTPPGVYIAEQANPVTVTGGLPPTRLTLVGRGQGSQTATEQIPLLSDGVQLAAKGILEPSVEVRAVSDDSLIEPTQYVLDKVTVSNKTNDFYYRISLVTGGEGEGEGLPEGTAVWVTYSFVPVDYDAVRIFDNPADVARIYGSAIDMTNDADPINSPLTLAAQIAFANGVREIITVPTKSTASSTSSQVRTDLSDAMQKVSSDYGSTVIVPLTDGLADADIGLAAADFRGFLATSAASGYYRVGIFGPPLGAGSPVDLINNSGLSHRRLIVAYASEEGLIYQNLQGGNRLMLGHQYLAAAYGGLMAALPVQQSLTRQRISGFAGMGAGLSTLTKNAYAAAGVALTEVDRQGRLIVRHGTSTDRSDVATAEPSVTRARDAMVNLLYNGMDNSGLIGSPMDDNTAMSVKSVVAGILEYCVATGTIVGYNSLQARVASLDPTVVEVRFAYRASFPLNYILVSFALDLTNGDVSETTATT